MLEKPHEVILVGNDSQLSLAWQPSLSSHQACEWSHLGSYRQAHPQAKHQVTSVDTTWNRQSLKFWPTKLWDTVYESYCFKPLSFRVACYAATNNWTWGPSVCSIYCTVDSLGWLHWLTDILFFPCSSKCSPKRKLPGKTTVSVLCSSLPCPLLHPPPFCWFAWFALVTGSLWLYVKP